MAGPGAGDAIGAGPGRGGAIEAGPGAPSSSSSPASAAVGRSEMGGPGATPNQRSTATRTSLRFRGRGTAPSMPT
ncbi:MAG TPA: hypothetical protein VMU14_24670, partial [Acidimicrobiales bacterium]|nr:hypothetical protein [Acidimicrobiales bacterium]